MTDGWIRVRAAAQHPYGPGLLLGGVLGLAVALQAKLVLVALVGGAVAVLGFRRPRVLVALMFLGMLFDRLGVTGMKVGSFPVTASKLSVLGTIGLWAAHALWFGVRPLRWHPVLTAMLGVVGSTAVAIAYSNSMAEGKFVLYGLGMMTVLVAVTYVILAEVPLDGLYRLLSAGFVLTLAASLRGNSARAVGTMGDPNEWATMILIVTPLLLGGLSDDNHGLARFLRIALVGLAPLAILRSESRAALAVGVLLAPATLWILRRHRGELLACAAGGLVAAPLVLNLGVAVSRFYKLVANLQGSAAEVDTSLQERSELARQALQLFKDNWVMGAGPGNFAIASGFISHEGTLRPAHNSYLEIASEQGVFGLSVVAIFGFTLASTMRHAWRGATSPRDRHRVAGAATGLAAAALMGATLGLITFSMAYLVLGIGLAVIHQAQGVPQAQRARVAAR